MKYNPGLMPEDALVDGFAVRHDELQTILGVVRDNQGQHNQHLLVLAPRGYGKSTLALRAVAELRRAPDLAAAWFPIVFSEESYQVRTTGELWLEALLHLSQATGDDRWRQAWKALRTEPDDTRLSRGALAHLLDFADAAGRRLLLVIENLDSLLGGDQLDPQDAWTLRHTLVQEPRIAVLATAVHRFPGIDQPDQAMFDLFRRVELGPLSPTDCRALLLAVTTADRTSADAAHPSLDGRQAHALRVLTGGNPRLLIMLAGFARDQDLDDVLGTLDRLVDDHTEYFRANIEALSGQNRRVFLALAELWRPASARAVAEAARMPVNEVSVALGRLVQQGRVEITRTRGRNHSYQVSERLYNIYYLLRRHRGADVRVQALVDFITRLYGPTQKDRSVRARLRGAIHGPAAAFEDLRPALIDPATVSADLQRAQADCMRLAAAGLSRELIALLEGAPTEEALRPLIAALRLRVGEEVDEPPEILAVAADVNANIDALIQTGEPWTTDPHSLPLPEP